jgi:hypothetical protein
MPAHGMSVAVNIDMKTRGTRLRDSVCAASFGLLSVSCAHRGSQHGAESTSAASPAPPPASLSAVSMDAAIPMIATDAALPDAISPEAERAALLRESAPHKDVLASPLQNDNPRELALARCHQQERCGLVGHGKKYMSSEQCLIVVLQEQRDRLIRYSCPSNTDVAALRRCTDTVRMSDCAQTFTSFDQLEACPSSLICRGTNSALPRP